MYVWVVQWQQESDVTPLVKEFLTKDDAMSYAVGNLMAIIHDIVFFSVTRRYA